MSTRGTLKYMDNKFLFFHMYHEMLDESVRLDLKLFGVWIFSGLMLKAKK